LQLTEILLLRRGLLFSPKDDLSNIKVDSSGVRNKNSGGMRQLCVGFSMIFLAVFLAAVVSADGGSAPEPEVKIIRLNFAAAGQVVGFLNAIKSSDGKVAVNEDGKTVALMDTPERLRAMESLIRQVDIQTVTAWIPLKFSQAGAILDQVRPLLTQSVGVIAADAATNRLVVTDCTAVIDRIRRAVEQLDPRGRKVMIEAKLVHVALDDEHLNGVDWSGIVEDHQQLHLDGRYVFLSGRDSGETLSLGTIEALDYVPLTEALDTVGVVKELPLTSVTVGSGSEVALTVRIDQPGFRLEPVDPEQGALSPAEGAVVEFTVKPEVDEEGDLKTAIVVKEPHGPGVKAYSRAPAVKHPVRSAVVHSMDGGSVVIGGIIATGQVLVPRKVPLVGNIPLLGLAFRYHNSTIRREEFVVILTLNPVSSMPQDPPAEGGKKSE
jgi:hypothetical protein